MPHKAGADFFDRPREWSRYKNSILEYYLKPYLSKVKDLRKPILLVDMFAGRGRFRDQVQTPGSPVILAERAKALIAAGHDCSLICIESNEELARDLKSIMSPYRFATVWHADCFAVLDRIVERALRTTAFLYIDPFAASQLNIEKLSKIYDLITHSSVEVLEVFMARSLMRQACKVLRLEGRQVKGEAPGGTDESDLLDDEWFAGPDVREGLVAAKTAHTSRQRLTSVLGGDYWERIAAEDWSFDEKILGLVRAYENRLANWFRMRAAVPIYADEGESVPKYWMLLRSRYEPAIDLFNDAAHKARSDQGIAWQRTPGLFGSVAIDPSANIDLALAKVREAIRTSRTSEWSRLRWAILRPELGRFKQAEVNQAIRRLIERGEIVCKPQPGQDEDASELSWTRA